MCIDRENIINIDIENLGDGDVALELKFSSAFNDINEMPVSRSRNIVLDVKMRKDKIEIDTSALERFDNL